MDFCFLLVKEMQKKRKNVRSIVLQMNVLSCQCQILNSMDFLVDLPFLLLIALGTFLDVQSNLDHGQKTRNVANKDLICVARWLWENQLKLQQLLLQPLQQPLLQPLKDHKVAFQRQNLHIMHSKNLVTKYS